VPDILIDIGRLLYRRLKGHLSTGIDRVGLEYVRHYGSRARAVLTWGPFTSVLSRPDSERAFRLLLDPEAPATQVILWLLVKAYLRWWAGPGVTDCVLFNTSHTGLDHSSYANGLRRRGARPVFVICDLIPITHPEYCRAGERARHVARMSNALTKANGIVTISRDTLEVLRGFAGTESLRLPPAVAAPLAPSLPLAQPGPRPIAEPYFVILGTIEPRKNHILLLQLWRQLIARHSSLVTRHSEERDALPRLVVIGQRGWKCENVVEMLERNQELKGFVIERNDCSDAELVTYLHHAQALLFPSFVEGYGLPLVEALAQGTPVIASDLPVFREMAGEIPEYADPRNDERWMELIADYSKPRSDRRAAQRSRMKEFRASTWEQHFKIVDEFLGVIGNR
jgi:glycosyltransferase involved in cell wall biosynthesis